MHPSPENRDRSRGGFTFIEVIVAVSILALALFAVFSAYDYYMKEGDRIRARGAIVEIENPVRQAVFEAMKNYMKAASATAGPTTCNLSAQFVDVGGVPPARTLIDRLTMNLPSGINLTVLDRPRLAALRIPPPDFQGSQQFNDGLARCANSPLAVSPIAPSDFRNRNAIYFCLEITSAAGSGPAGSILSMTPIYGEFTYVNMHVSSYLHPAPAGPGPGPAPPPIPVAFGPLNCVQLKDCFQPPNVNPPAIPAHGVLGELFYALYWTPRILKGQMRMRAFSVVARGGT